MAEKPSAGQDAGETAQPRQDTAAQYLDLWERNLALIARYGPPERKDQT